MDAATREQVRLRANDRCECYFIGRTSIGRATVRVLGMNESEQVDLRLHLLEPGTLA
jgi:hypothetical protein